MDLYEGKEENWEDVIGVFKLLLQNGCDNSLPTYIHSCEKFEILTFSTCDTLLTLSLVKTARCPSASISAFS